MPPNCQDFVTYDSSHKYKLIKGIFLQMKVLAEVICYLKFLFLLMPIHE